MHQCEIDQLRRDVLGRVGVGPLLDNVDVLHSWELSHVERLRLADGGSLVFKCATEPFTHEHTALLSALQAGVDVPRVEASIRTGTLLGMLMEDMGAPDCDPTDAHGIAAAVRLHAAAVPPHLPPADAGFLASLPERALRNLRLLYEEDRWEGTDDIGETLSELARAGRSRAEGALTPPYGWVHGEFHPESVLVRGDRVRLYDFARAFRGPGLIDLASWHGTVDTPDPDATRVFIEGYVEAGGESGALAPRGGLDAERWALGWHRVWALEWFLAQAVTWIADPAADSAYITAVRRHVGDGAELLKI
ncbi:phosphotransferase family protein [Nocardiopsis mangrovi]|uniref:Phosphotransferase family protein n=1 Tax=Nocardiopsis mangrovi TaxID=1179818 RepID=A0ABV9DNV6_9ACTN